MRAFERGELAADEFASRFISQCGLSIAPEDFLERFASWPKGFFPGAGALLTAIRRDYTIAYLSNSNAIHYRVSSGHGDRPGPVMFLEKPDRGLAHAPRLLPEPFDLGWRQRIAHDREFRLRRW